MKSIILASKSPRRIQILKDLQIPFKIVPSNFEEKKYEKSKLTPLQYALYNAREKAYDSAKKIKDGIVVGMDTIGAINGRVLGKPRDKKHARAMIKTLSGKTHSVITGIHLYDVKTKKELSAAEITHVTFTDMTDKEIDYYLKLGMWRDVACAYAIQEKGELFIERIEGDYFNVVGFPVFKFGQLMKQFGMPLWDLINK
ncbi:septum formation protein Maf [Candidatus Peregrinibacteria bacterium]|nr:septum formation protein Maf [Candidatus Peregrinibacteria bacterium]